MATQTTHDADAFYRQLGRMYGTYTGGFIAFIFLVALLEWVGTPNRILGYLFVGFTIAVYAVIGVMTRTAQVSEYYVAGRRVPAFYNGMATGADWMSAASFVGMAGTIGRGGALLAIAAAPLLVRVAKQRKRLPSARPSPL